MPAHFQRAADCADTAIHHIGRCDNVGPGLGLVERLINQHRDGVIIQYIAFGVDQPVLAVRGIGVERDVGEHTDGVAMPVLDRADRAYTSDCRG